MIIRITTNDKARLNHLVRRNEPNQCPIISTDGITSKSTVIIDLEKKSKTVKTIAA